MTKNEINDVANIITKLRIQNEILMTGLDIAKDTLTAISGELIFEDINQDRRSRLIALTNVFFTSFDKLKIMAGEKLSKLNNQGESKNEV